MRRIRTKGQKIFILIIAVLLVIAMLILPIASVFAADDTSQQTSFERVKMLSDKEVLDNASLYDTYKDDCSDLPSTKCETVLLFDLKSGQIIYNKNGDVQRTPASITKVMTAILVLEKLDLDHVVTVPKEATGVSGHSMELKEGEKLTVEQLMNAMLVYSANDAALALAIEAGGSIESFTAMMNQRAKDIGLEHTVYLNPNGYTESYDHTTTARDLKALVTYALKNDVFKGIIKKSKCTIEKTNKSDERKFESTNKLLFSKEKVQINGKTRVLKYDGTFGVKTGMMASSGNCYVGAASKDETELAVVCLKGANDNDRFTDAIEMFDFGFKNFKTVELLEPGAVAGKAKIQYARSPKVKVLAVDGAYGTVLKSKGDKAADNLTYKVEYNEGLKAPLKEGTVVGKVKVYDGDEVVSVSAAVLSKDVKKGGPWSKYYISDFVAYLLMFLLLLIIAFIVIVIVVKVKRNKNRIYSKRRRNSSRNRSRRRGRGRRR